MKKSYSFERYDYFNEKEKEERLKQFIKKKYCWSEK